MNNEQNINNRNSNRVSSGKKKILIIDDDTATVRILVDALSEHDTSYEVVSVSDGEQGIAKAKEIQPDLILLDMSMPKLSGIEVLQRMQSDPALKGIRTVILSQTSDMEKLEEAELLGAKEYIIKADMDLDSMLEKIDSQFLD